MKVDYREVVEFLWELFETMSRRDCGLILAGYRQLPSGAHGEELLRRLERRGFIERRGRGHKAVLRFAANAPSQETSVSPSAHWDRRWDSKWRIVTYDLPMHRRKDRFALWRALRGRKLGLLQQSVWVWPHPMEAILTEIIQTTGIPECFCGFEAVQVFLCTHQELVTAAWDFKEIQARHQRYLEHLVATPAAARRAGDFATLGRLGRIERVAYQHAFSVDPLLPRALTPEAYQGYAVEARHQEFRRALVRRARELATA